MTHLNETSLGRVWQHFSDETRPVALLTAFRGIYDYDENTTRNRSLSADIRQLGYGFIYVDGYWIENSGTPLEQRVKEDSIFVIGARGDIDFAKKMHALGNKYDQDAVLVKDTQGTRVIFQDGTVEPKQALKVGSLGDVYTQLRSNKKARSFTFVEERDDIGFIARLAGLKSK